MRVMQGRMRPYHKKGMGKKEGTPHPAKRMRMVRKVPHLW
jgi:hypothetical protein